MTTIKIKFLTLFAFIIIVNSCDLLTNDGDSPKHDYKNLVAFLARFEERDNNGEIISRPLKAIVADFYNTSNYEIITSDTVMFWTPRFSPDKKNNSIRGIRNQF